MHIIAFTQVMQPNKPMTSLIRIGKIIFLSIQCTDVYLCIFVFIQIIVLFDNYSVIHRSFTWFLFINCTSLFEVIDSLCHCHRSNISGHQIYVSNFIYFQVYVSFVETNALTFVPQHLMLQLTPLYVFQLSSDHIRGKHKAVMSFKVPQQSSVFDLWRLRTNIAQ